MYVYVYACAERGSADEGTAAHGSLCSRHDGSRTKWYVSIFENIKSLVKLKAPIFKYGETLNRGSVCERTHNRSHTHVKSHHVIHKRVIHPCGDG